MNNRGIKRKVLKKNKHGLLIATYASLGIAAKENGASRQSVSMWCQGKTRDRNGWFWSYK